MCRMASSIKLKPSDSARTARRARRPTSEENEGRMMTVQTMPAQTSGEATMAQRLIDTPVGPLLLRATDHGLAQVAFHAQVAAGATAPVSSGATSVATTRTLDEAARQIGEYFAGQRRVFDLPFDLRGVPAFERDVLDRLMAIPYGETTTYGAINRSLGPLPDGSHDARRIGEACGANPLPIVIPCHRVIRSDGKLGGYGGGYRTKVRLLRGEAALPPAWEQLGLAGR